MGKTNNKDYYKILGITEEEKQLSWDEFVKVVKSKYKKLALIHHPDRQHDKTEEEKKKAEEIFKDISEAYTILSDKEKKTEYDNPINGFGGFNPFGGNPFGFDPFEFFGGGRSHARHREQYVERGNSIRIEIPLTLEEIFEGVNKKVKYKRQEPCHECNGSGLGKDGHVDTCPTCGGTGQEFSVHGNVQMMTTCRRCGGSGKIIVNPCSTCQGSGLELKDHEVSIDIPKGVVGGMEMVVEGEGGLTKTKDGIPGNLHVLISEKEHDKFVRRGNDLLFELNIPILDALSGSKQNVETIDGKTLSTTIAQGTEDGVNIKFANKGMPIYGKDGRFGHMIGIVKLRMPKTLNNEEKELIERLKEQEHFKDTE